MLGVINVNKPTGYSSSDVVVVVRGMLRKYFGEKNIKVGHLGTLDIGGSGVLPIVFGKATKLFDYLSASRKKYRAEFVFGKLTDTLDSYGEVVAVNDKSITHEEIESVLPSFIGEIDQVPPKYSRVSVGGVRGYEAMRRGDDIEMPTKKVAIYSINILSFKDNRLVVDVECSGGTYIRSLARDIAETIGTVAYMSWIIRLETKSLTISESVTLDELRTDIGRYIQPIDGLIGDIVRVDISDKRRILDGLPVSACGIKGDYLGIIDGRIYGIVRDEADSIKTIINLYEY